MRYVLDGCCGSYKFRNQSQHIRLDHGTRVTLKVRVTCPCTRYRAVAQVDRGQIYFRQRLPRSPSDFSRQPLLTGMRAYTTRLTNLVAHRGDVEKGREFFGERFRWFDETKRCGYRDCGSDDFVLPAFEDGFHSVMACHVHRELLLREARRRYLPDGTLRQGPVQDTLGETDTWIGSRDEAGDGASDMG